MPMTHSAMVMAATMILAFGVSISPALAGYEDIEPESVGSPDQWQLSGAPTKVLAVTDADDFTYIYEDTAGHIQDFTLSDPIGIDVSDTIDSVNVIWRGEDSGSGTNQARVNLYLSGSTSSGSIVDLTTAWTDYTDSFADKPGGSGWTIDDINALEVQTQCMTIAKNRTIRCSKIHVRVYYTPAAEDASPRRRKIKTKLGG